MAFLLDTNNSKFNRLVTLSVTAACASTAFTLTTESSAKASTLFSSQNISQTLIMGSPSSSQSNCLQLGQSLPGINQSMTLCSPQSASKGGITIGGITIGSSQTSSSNSQITTTGSQTSSSNSQITTTGSQTSSSNSQITTTGSQTSSQNSNFSSSCLTSNQSLNSSGGSIDQFASMCAPQEPTIVINTGNSSTNPQITIGKTQTNPVLPTMILSSGVFSFVNVFRSLWIDPPTAPGFRYTMTGDSLFTKILDFPTGIDSDNLFNVSVGNISLGQFRPGETVDFIALLGNGVREFTVSGIDSLIDSNNPTAFPIQLDFNTETASFEQIALNADEVQNTRVPEPSSTLSLIALAAFGYGSQFVFRHKKLH